MANSIKVTPSKLTSTAKSFDSTGKQINELTGQMLTTISSTSDWIGDASNAYKKKFTELQDDMQRITKMISEHVSDLNEMAKGYESAEQTNVSTAKALSGEIVC